MTAIISTPAPTLKQFKFPILTIPEDVIQSDYSTPQFTIQTTEGLITVVTHWCHDRFRCKGSIDALVAAGLMASEWMPGLMGNHATCQNVTFDDNGPRLYFAKGRRPDKTIMIEIVSADCIEVRVPLTAEQKIWVKAKGKEWMKEEEREAASVAAAKSSASPQVSLRAPTPQEAHIFCLAKVSCIGDDIERIFKDTGHTFSFNSMNRIKGSLDALLIAVKSAQIGRLVPKYPRVGNVIQFPQRTR